jgi:hypothetical protein
MRRRGRDLSSKSPSFFLVLFSCPDVGATIRSDSRQASCLGSRSHVTLDSPPIPSLSPQRTPPFFLPMSTPPLTYSNPFSFAPRRMEFDLDAIEEEDSPYPEVRASVSNIDDPDMPALTIRMWFIGLFLCSTGG